MLCFYLIGKNKKKNNYANILMKQEKKSSLFKPIPCHYRFN